MIPVKDILGGQLYDQWLDLTDKTGTPVGCPDKATKGPGQSRLHISIQFRPVGVKVGSQWRGGGGRWRGWRGERWR